MHGVPLAAILLLGLSVYTALAQDDDDKVTCSWGDCTEPCGGGRRRCDRSNGKVWHISCHNFPCSEEKRCGVGDVVFILDESSSIGEQNWWRVKQFTIDAINGMLRNQQNMRFGAITFSRSARVHFTLDTFTTDAKLENLEAAIWALNWTTGVTNTYLALKYAEDILTKQARPHAKHLVMLITDGMSTILPERTVPQAQKMHAKGIEIFVIGVGKVELEEIQGISGPMDDHYHLISSFTSLKELSHPVVEEFCHAALPIIETCEWTNCSAACGTGHRECTYNNGTVWQLPCHVQECRTVKCGFKDVVFVLDSSASIGYKNWEREKQFAIDVAKALPERQVHIAMITYSDKAELDWGLNVYEDRDVLENEIWSLDWMEDVTHTADALELAKQVVSSGSRPNTKPIVIVMTDGQSNTFQNMTIPMAQALHEDDTEVFCIAVRVNETEEYDAIASLPYSTHLHLLRDYEALSTIVSTVVNQTCLEEPFPDYD